MEVVSTADLAVQRALRLVALDAARAPSVHNTQPWLFITSPSGLELRADRRRRLTVVDPDARQLFISCGCALFNARVSAAAAGLHPHVARFPSSTDEDLVARIAIDRGAPASNRQALTRLHPFIEVRQTNRRRFAVEEVPPGVVATLVRVAGSEGARLLRITDPVDRSVVADLAQYANQLELLDPAYRAELRAWTTNDPTRRDGVPALAVPRVGPPSMDELPIRDFDTYGAGYLPAATASTTEQCLLLLTTKADDPMAWVRAGEALERVLLEVTRHGFTARPYSQLIEVATTRSQLRTELRIEGFPQLLLQIGRAAPAPGTGRRPLREVLVER